MTSHIGSCHCGEVRIQVELGELSDATTCNCSICSRAGWKLTFVPESSVEVLGGRERLTDYQFGKEHIHHVFCSRCGIRPFSYGAGPEGTTMYAINLNCLEGFDTSGLTIKENDGRSL